MKSISEFKVLLVFSPGEEPALFSGSWNLQTQDYGHFPPLGLLYLASALRHHGVKHLRVMDCAAAGLSMGDIQKELSAFKPDLVGISAFTITFKETLDIVKTVKKTNPQAHVCIGGPHVQHFPEQTLAHPQVDSIIRGEGEIPICSLVDTLCQSGEIKQEIPGIITRENMTDPAATNLNKIEVLDSLLFPARDLVAQNHYYSVVGIRPKCLTVITSRGCPYPCTFCDTPFKDIRFRSITNVMEEISQACPDNKTEIYFWDETLNVSPKRFTDLCDGLKKFGIPWSFRGRADRLDRDMLRSAAESGCYQMHLGLETTKDENLAFLKKELTIEQVKKTLADAKSLDIRVILNLMIIMPFEKSEGDIYEMIRQVIDLNPYLLQLNVFRPEPGTEIFEQGVEKGILSWDPWNEFVLDPYKPFAPKTWDEHISQNDVGRIWQKSYQMFYFRPSKIKELIFGLRSFWEFKQKFLNGVHLFQ